MDCTTTVSSENLDVVKLPIGALRLLLKLVGSSCTRTWGQSGQQQQQEKRIHVVIVGHGSSSLDSHLALPQNALDAALASLGRCVRGLDKVREVQKLGYGSTFVGLSSCGSLRIKSRGLRVLLHHTHDEAEVPGKCSVTADFAIHGTSDGMLLLFGLGRQGRQVGRGLGLHGRKLHDDRDVALLAEFPRSSLDLRVIGLVGGLPEAVELQAADGRLCGATGSVSRKAHVQVAA